MPLAFEGDSFMRWDRSITLSLMHPLTRMGLLRTIPGIPILMYHSISVDAETGVTPYYRLTTSPRRFREHMQQIRDTGHSVVSLDEALDTLTRAPDARGMVVLTFDDGFRDFLTNAWPILDEFG